MCGKIMTVLLIFVVLNCSMARYNGRLHCIVGVLPTCYKRKAATYFYPPGGTGLIQLGYNNSLYTGGFFHYYISWTSPFVILRVWGLFCRFYSFFMENHVSIQCRP